MTIDRTTVKAGDKLHTRQGDVLMARVGSKGGLYAGPCSIRTWNLDGRFTGSLGTKLDIIRIEKHAPVVVALWVTQSDMYDTVEEAKEYAYTGAPVYKITITDGVPNIEKVE